MTQIWRQLGAQCASEDMEARVARLVEESRLGGLG